MMLTINKENLFSSTSRKIILLEMDSMNSIYNLRILAESKANSMIPSTILILMIKLWLACNL
jgi:hypothetical protein